jgi:multidrug transporter EmrE-like cation transporter
MAYLYLALAFVCNGSANVLLKLAALRQFSFSQLLHGTITPAAEFAFFAALLFAANLGFYLLALERIPLSTGYPVMIGMTFVITIVASLFLGERIGLLPAFGMALILIGMFFVVRFSVV